jgi:hypothetical protein
MKLKKNNKIETNSINPLINFSQTKDEILFGQKSFLEILLGLIKKAQVDYLTSNKLNDKNNPEKSNNIFKIKQILNDLKESLLEIKNEKLKKIDLFEKQKEQKRINLKKIIFNTVYTKRSVSNYNYINNNYETLITENNENYYNKETPELKLLNFKVENEIIKVDNLSRRKLYIIQYYKTPHLIHEHRTEIICEDRKNNEAMNTLLHQKLIQQREKFIEIVNMKSLQDMKISNMQSQAIGYKNAMKDIQKSYRYVNTQEIITEENKSYLETVNEDIKNEEKLKKSQNSENSENSENGNNINMSDNNININNKSNNNENNINNDLKNLKLIDMNEVEKLLKLNMNINVNINYNKQYINNHFDSKKKVGNDDDNEANSSNFSKNENVGDDFDEIDKNECKNMEDENFDDSFKKNNKTG